MQIVVYADMRIVVYADGINCFKLSVETAFCNRWYKAVAPHFQAMLHS